MDLILKKNIELNFNCCASNNTNYNINKNKNGYDRNLLLNVNCCSDNNKNIIFVDAHNNKNKNRNNIIKKFNGKNNQNINESYITNEYYKN